MKILFIISSLSSGGAERVIANLSNELCKKHTIIIATFSNDESFYPLDKNILHLKLDLIKESNNKLDRLKNIVGRIFLLKRTMQTVNADVCVSFITHTNILTILAAKLAKQKIVISERIAFSFYNSKILNFLRKNIYPLSDYLVVQTFDDKKNYSYIKNIDVIHNPLCINDAKAPKEKIILGVGRLEKQKGFDVLIKAFSKTPNTKWKLYIAGDGQEKKSLIDLIQDYGLTNVELIGKRKDIFDWYAKASIFVLSSQQEGFPNALLEAMAFGCASISFDCPSGPNEIINDNKNGLLIENQHHEKLAQAIQMLMENEEIRSKIGQEAMYIKEKYSIKIIASEWEALLNKVVRK